MLTLGHYTHHVWCPHLFRTLQQVVDEVSLLMWMPGHCSGTTPMLVRGPSKPRAGVPAPPLEVYPTSMATSRRWSFPPRSMRQYMIWGTTIWGACTPRSLGRRGAGPKGKGTDPQRNRGPPSVARPPQCRLGAPSAGAHAEVACRSQGPVPGRCACVLGGGGCRGACGENHQGGDRIPQRVCREGLYCHEGHHGGRVLGAGTPGVLLAP